MKGLDAMSPPSSSPASHSRVGLPFRRRRSSIPARVRIRGLLDRLVLAFVFGATFASTSNSNAQDEARSPSDRPLRVEVSSHRYLGDFWFRGFVEVDAAAKRSLYSESAAVCPVMSGPAARVYVVLDGTRAAIVGNARGPGLVRLRLPVEFGDDRPIEFEIVDTTVALGESTKWLDAWLRSRWFDNQRESYEEGYSEFLAKGLASRFGRDAPAGIRDFRRVGSREPPHPYDLFTGAAAMRESMQLDIVVASDDATDTDASKEDVRSIAAVSLEDHPFEEMRSGRPWHGSKLARFCPSDAIFARVRSLEEWFAIYDLVDDWGGSLLSALSIRGADRGIPDRYATQLGFGNETIARLLGTKLIGEFAVIVSDPLFQEGAGVALVLSPIHRQESALRGLLDAQRKAIASFDSARKLSKESILGVAVDVLESPSGSVRSWHCIIDGTDFFANSPALLRRIIAAARDETPSLVDVSDYHYYRALYPVDAEESAFIYLSQDWFRRITGPRFRIAHGRRRAALVAMQDLRWGWETALETRPSIDFDGLEEGRWIDASLRDRFGLGLDARSGAVTSAHYGSLSHPIAIDDVEVSTVSRHESEQYRRFRDSYRDYWRRFIDPVGIRLRRTNAAIDVETLILPLIENSIYDGIRGLVGSRNDSDSFSAPLPRTALGAVTLALNPLALPFDDWIGSPEFRISPEALGGSITLGVADGDPLFTGSASAGFALSTFIGFEEVLLTSFLISSLALPTFAAIEVRDADTIARDLEKVLRYARAKSDRRGGWDIGVDSHESPGTPKIRTVVVDLFILELRIHYAFVDRWLLLATRLDLLEEWIALVRQTPSIPFGDHVRLDIRPQNFALSARQMGLSWQDRAGKACAGNLAPLHRMTLARVEKDAATFLGYRPLCPDGGEYRFVNGEQVCTIHGSKPLPMRPLVPSSSAPAVRLIRRVDALGLDFSFTGDGLRTRLRMSLIPVTPPARAGEGGEQPDR
jgi:hypothetical protein